MTFGDMAAAKHLHVAEARRSKFRHNDYSEFGRVGRVWRPTDWYFGKDFISDDEMDAWKREGGASDSGPSPTKEGTYMEKIGAVADRRKAGVAIYPFYVSSASTYMRGNPWY